MGNFSIDYKRLSDSIITSPKGLARVNTIAQRKFDAAKKILIEEFLNHPVTKEIEEGIDADNISGTLGGYGNLFSFIGFHEGDNPIEPVVAILENQLVLISNSNQKSVISSVVSGNKVEIIIKFTAKVPRDALEEATPLPWESGLSWLYSIEKGISGFGHYLSSKMNSLSKRKRPDRFPNPPSRSEGGVETKNIIRGGDFKPVPYFQTLIRNLVNYIREAK